MTNETKVTNWLEDNTNLSRTRTTGDSPAVRDDRLYINRGESYEIRDLILNYYKKCNLVHKDENYAKTYKKIIKYKKGEKVKTEDMLKHLKDNNENCK